MKGVVSNRIDIIDLKATEKDELKEQLTLENPMYKIKKKYNRFGYTSEPQYLQYYFEKPDIKAFSVPRGVYCMPYMTDIEDKTVNERLDCAEYKFAAGFKLRDEQKKAVTAYLDKNSTLDLNGIIQQRTGEGKTVTCLAILQQLHTPTLVIMHKDDLIRQWQSEIDFVFDGKVKPGLIKSKNKTIGNFITLATIQTLSRMSIRELTILRERFSAVVTDECHHCPSITYELVDHFPARYRIGLSATPERRDGLSSVIEFHFGGYAYRNDIADTEHILPVMVRIVYLSYVRLENSYSDYAMLDRDILTQAMEGICSCIYHEFKSGHSCVVFFRQIESCVACKTLLMSLFKVDENKIGMFNGSVGVDEQVATLMMAEENRQFITIATYSKGTEGTNVKRWEVAFLASSVNDGRTVEQAIGRIRRANLGKLKTARVYDFRYPNVSQIVHHGFTRSERYDKLGFRFVTNFD